MTLAPFVRTGNGVHPVIDLEQLQAQYPQPPDDVWNISTASNLLTWENLRAQHEIAAPDAVPCDIFLWGIGEPPDRRLTRVGGVPWLPKSIPWPTFGDTAGTFLCQFDFRDSKDLHGQLAGTSLPGDLLLVFVADCNSAMTGEAEDLQFVWVSADEVDVYTQDDVPAGAPSFEFVTAWGARFRSKDMPSQWETAYKIAKRTKIMKLCSLPVLWATKIGGVPHDSQNNLDAPPPGYLCQLVSIQAGLSTWPWIDHEQPLADDFGGDGIYADKHRLMIGDMGELTLFMHDDGTITASSACG